MQGYQTPKQSTDAQRCHWLARIHIKAQQLNLEGDAHRLTLLALSGAKTCEGLDAGQLEQLYYGLVEIARDSGREDNSAQALQRLLA